MEGVLVIRVGTGLRQGLLSGFGFGYICIYADMYMHKYINMDMNMDMHMDMTIKPQATAIATTPFVRLPPKPCLVVAVVFILFPAEK